MRKPFYWKERRGWYLRIPKPAGGLRTVKLADTKAAAYDVWQRMQTEAKASHGDGDGGKAVTELVTEYTVQLKEQVRLGQLERVTVKRRMDHLLPFVEYLASQSLGSLSVADLKPHHVSAWLNSQTRWGATTRHHGAEEVKRAINWGRDQGHVATNPIERLRVAKGAPRDHLVSRDEYGKLLAGVRQSKYTTRTALPFRLYLMGLWHSGCRPGEMTTVDIADVDLAGATWTIYKHKNRRKKKSKPRIVYLSPCLVTISRIAAAGRDSGPLFAKHDGSQWHYSNLRRRFERLRKKVGADPKCVLYSFRHTWITNALLAGVDVATAAEMAGTSIRMIDEHYGHLAKHGEHMKKAALQAARGRIG